MNRTEFFEIIANGENSHVDFESDDCQSAFLAREVSDLLNLQGGFLLLGVEDDGQVTGLIGGRKRSEEWVMSVARNHLHPSCIPVRVAFKVKGDKIAGVTKLGNEQPGKALQGKVGQRMGNIHASGKRLAKADSRERSSALPSSGIVRYETSPVGRHSGKSRYGSHQELLS